MISATGAYRLALGVLELLPALLDGLGVPRLAQPVIDRLAEETGESAHLAALERGRVLYLVSASSRRLLRTDTPPGLRLEPHATALGKSLLAQLPDAEARQLLGAEPYSAVTPRTLTTWEEMERELTATRRRGYALSEGELEEGLSSCAVALPARADRPYAINVSSPASRMPRKAGARAPCPAARAGGKRDRRPGGPVRVRPGSAGAAVTHDPGLRPGGTRLRGLGGRRRRRAWPRSDPWRPGKLGVGREPRPAGAPRRDSAGASWP